MVFIKYYSEHVFALQGR